MTFFDNVGPWQLYTFSAVNILGSLSMYGILFDPCQFITGQTICQPGAETLLSRLQAIGFLYVGTFFLVLTYINKTNTSKVRRLANMAMNCTVAILVMVIFFGSRSKGGFENSTLHFLDMITAFLLLLMMGLAINDNSEMIGSNSPLTGLRFNPKTFVFLIAVLTVIKLFAMSDFVDISIILHDPDSITALSHIMYQMMVVLILMILFPIAFALFYGDEKDQEAITGATVLMMLISILSIIPIADCMKDGMITQSYFSVGITSLLGISMIYVGRLNQGRNEYNPV
jgi:hypothetical protein